MIQARFHDLGVVLGTLDDFGYLVDAAPDQLSGQTQTPGERLEYFAFH